MIRIFIKTLVLSLASLCISTAMGASYTYWLNGWKKISPLETDYLLVTETPHYIYTLNPSDLTSSHFGKRAGAFSYGAYGATVEEIEALEKMPLDIAISLGGERYLARESKAGKSNSPRALQDILLWESGRHFHRYEFKDIDFVSDSGKVLPIYSDLMFSAWDNVFTLKLDSQRELFYSEGVAQGIVGAGHCIAKEKLVIPSSDLNLSEEFTFSFWLKVPEKFWQVTNGRGFVCMKGNGVGSEGSFGISVKDIYRYGAFMYSDRSVNSPLIIGDKTWNLFTITYDKGIFRYYVNNRLVSQRELKKGFEHNEDNLVFGSHSETAPEIYSMLVDEIRVWDRVLEEPEIQTMWNRPEAMPSKANLVYEKNFNENKVTQPEYIDLKGAELSMSFGGEKVTKLFESDLALGESASLTLPVYIKKADDMSLSISKNGNPLKVEFDQEKQCFKTVFHRKQDALANKRERGTCYYDDFELSVKGEGEIPFLLHMKKPNGINGLVPMLCYRDGRPTGIQVQLSKNWHERMMGHYLMAYAKIPEGDYILRISYGFYGQYPSASHANLSLIGYGGGGSGRWEQLAVGTWGETICFDVDNSLRENMITDIRVLMARNGKNGRKWGWTDAGWGGDWLRVGLGGYKRLLPVGLKTTYTAQGSCLTDVTYEGFLGENRQVSMKVRVQTARTGDYARTFQKLEYTFNEDVEASDYSLYNLKNISNTIAMGDKSGAVNEYSSKGDSKPMLDFAGDKYPLWFSAMGREKYHNMLAVGYKALAIRDFSAKIGGKIYNTPEVLFKEELREIDLIAPKQGGAMSFKKGDFISMDIELFTLHARAEDYYGEDAEYIKHLEENPMSYKTAQREALGNDLQVIVKGGELLRAYPVEILARAGEVEVEVEIEGGVGLVPLRVEGLDSGDYLLYQILEDGKRVKLDQSVAGNDYYQLEYDNVSKTYAYVFNLPLNGALTRWVLQR